jgi:PilZ domain
MKIRRTGPCEGGEEGVAEVERRTAARLDKVFPVFIEGDGGGALGVARNISEGGMFVETRTPEPIGAQVRITFPSGAGEMTAVAEVRYVCHLLGKIAEGPSRRAVVRGMGLRFLYFEAQGSAPPILQ